MRTMLSTVAALAALAAGAAHADVAAAPARQPDTELGAFVGVHLFSPENGLGRAHGAPDSNALTTSGSVGIRLGWLVDEWWSFEGEIDVSPTGTKDGAASYAAIGLRAHALVHLATGRFRPFLLIGGGVLLGSTTNPTVIATDIIAVMHAGAGFQVRVGRSWGIRVDARLLLPQSTGSGVTEDWEVLGGLYGTFPSL